VPRRSEAVYGGPWPELRLRALARDGYRCQVKGQRCRGEANRRGPHHPVEGWRSLVGPVEFEGGVPFVQHGEGICGV
jgi:hypothetical protein